MTPTPLSAFNVFSAYGLREVLSRSIRSVAHRFGGHTSHGFISPIGCIGGKEKIMWVSKTGAYLLAAVLALDFGAMSAMAQADDGNKDPENAKSEKAEEKPKRQLQIIHAGRLMQDAREDVKSERSVIIEDGRVVAVEKGYVDATYAPDADTAIIDLKDRFVMPGLMDMHVHLSFQRSSEGQDVQGMSDEYAEQTRNERQDTLNLIDAIGHAEKTLMAGYTTVRNVGGTGWHIFTLRDAIADGKVKGPRIYTAGHRIRIGTDKGGGACHDVSSCRKAARRQIDMGADLIKVYATCSGAKPCGGEDGLSVFLQDELESVVAVAHTRALKVAAHAHGTDGINAALRAGVDSIEHGTYNNKVSRELFKEQGAYLVSTALVIEHMVKKRVDDAEEPRKSRMEKAIVQHPRRMHEAYKSGVKLAAGSDAGIVPHGLNAKELEVLVEAGIPARTALIAATIHGAELLGEAGELGTLEPGTIADVIAVEGDPLENIKVLQEIGFVMKAGRIYKQPNNEENE